jgi:hypothetical protein
MGPLGGFWPKLAGACGRVDGIIETCKIATIILKIHPRPVPAGRVLTNKQVYILYPFYNVQSTYLNFAAVAFEKLSLDIC